jgi:ATP-dependent helicase HrpB
MLIEAKRRGCLREGAKMASLLSERDLLRSSKIFGRQGGSGPPFTGPSDVLYRLELLDRAGEAGFRADKLKNMGVDPAAARRVFRAAKQFESIAAEAPGRRGKKKTDEQDLLRVLFAGFPDRVARRKKKGKGAFLMVGGRGAVLAEDSVVRNADLILGLSVEGGRKGIHARSLIRMASMVESAWLEQDFPDLMRTEATLSFDEKRERVTGVERLLFDDLPLEERSLSGIDPVAAAGILVRAASERLEAALSLDPKTTAFLDRIRSVKTWMPELGMPAFGPDELRALLPEVCAGKKSFAETRKVPLLPLLKTRLGGSRLALLERHAPEMIAIPSGRKVPLAYEPGRPPMLSVRIQEVFGLMETPAVAGGKVRVLMDLLGPNMRTVQRTEDLKNFWNNTYNQVRKDLRPRYPKHEWPENPLEAKPSGGSSRRRR